MFVSYLVPLLFSASPSSHLGASAYPRLEWKGPWQNQLHTPESLGWLWPTYFHQEDCGFHLVSTTQVISLRVLRGLLILMPLVIFSGVPSELGGGDIPLPHDGCRQSLGFDNAIVTRCQMNWNWCCFMGLLCHKSLDQAPILYHRRCHSELGWIKRKQCIWNVL